MRAEAESLAGVDNLKSELVPFTFPVMEDTQLRLKTFPCAAPQTSGIRLKVCSTLMMMQREGA